MWITYSIKPYFKTAGKPTSERFMIALDKMLRHLEGDGSNESKQGKNSIGLTSDPHEWVCIKDKHFAGLISELHKATMDDLKDSCALGYSQGSNLLMELQSGNKSVEDFNRAITKNTKLNNK